MSLFGDPKEKKKSIIFFKNNSCFLWSFSLSNKEFAGLKVFFAPFLKT